MTTTFRPPTSEMPEWVRIYGGTHMAVYEGMFGIVLVPDTAEALIKVLLEVCPNAAEIVGAWARAELVRTKLAEFKETMQGQTIPEIERVMDERAEAAVKARQTIVKDTP